MKQNKFLNDSQEQVIIIPEPRIIKINNATSKRAYGLFDTETGTQVRDFIRGDKSPIEFSDLNPSKHYDVGVAENIGDEKPQFAISWNWLMKDTTDEVLNNSGGFPVEYPNPYVIIHNDNNQNVSDIVDDTGETVGQVMKVSSTDDKPYIRYIHTFRMKDDTDE